MEPNLLSFLNKPKFVAATAPSAVMAGQVRAAFAVAAGADWTPVYVKDVEILEVGEQWNLSTGPRTFTSEDLAAAVAAQDDPAIHTPILKLGHKDTRAGFDPNRDGTPSFGKAINLRTKNDGMTLVADFAGVPKWMADAMPTSWPTRSIEGCFDAPTATGNTHPFVVTAVALLAEGPGIETLEDLPLALGMVAASDQPNAPRFTGRIAASNVVMASVSYEDVRRAYYETTAKLADGWAWWIRELVIDPPQLIVCDPEDALWQVPYTIAGQDVTFAEPVAVRIEYVAAASPTSRDGVLTYASREQSRSAIQAASTETEGDNVDLAVLRQSLGLPDSTPDAEVLRLASERLAPPAAPTPTAEVTPPAADPETPAPVAQATPPAAVPAQSPPPAPVAQTPPETTPAPAPVAEVTPEPTPELRIPEGAVLVDAAQWAEMQSRVQTGELAAGRLIREDRERYIGAVIAAGRMSPQNTSLRSVIEAAWNRNPAEADAIVDNLAQAFPVTEIGHAAGGIEAGQAAQTAVHDAEDVSLFRELGAVRAGKAS